jgi:hypothetical protein
MSIVWAGTSGHLCTPQENGHCRTYLPGIHEFLSEIYLFALNCEILPQEAETILHQHGDYDHHVTSPPGSRLSSKVGLLDLQSRQETAESDTILTSFPIKPSGIELMKVFTFIRDILSC